MVLIIVGLLAVLFVVLIHNSVISKKNEIKNAEGGLDASLKQRYDLIPNLVASAKEFMNHEKSVLETITQLRVKALKPDLSLDEKEALNKSISQELGKILVSVEAYPELKSSTNMIQLQQSLWDVEENIAASRRFF